MLEKAIEDYLGWMIDKGYPEDTWKRKEYTLRCFSSYITEHHIPWENIFTYRTVDAFIKQHRSHRDARQSTEGLWRYLLAQGRIKEPLIKKRPLPSVYEDYLLFYQTGVLHEQVQKARTILSALNDFLIKKNRELSEIKISDVDNFITGYTALHLPKERRNKRYCIAAFLRYLYYERRILTRDLAALLTGPPLFAHTKPPKFLSSHEIQELLKLKPITSWELRAYAMLHLAANCGLRSKEISLITLDDISFGKGEVKITKRKNGVPIILPLPSDTIKAIAAYIVSARPKTTNRIVFISLIAPYESLCSAVISRNISRYVRRVNPSASAYWLRHTYAQRLLEKEVSIFEIKEMLGHESIQSTKNYLHINTKLMREVLLDESL